MCVNDTLGLTGARHGDMAEWCEQNYLHLNEEKIIINKCVFAMLQTIKLLLHISFIVSHVHPIKDHQGSISSLSVYSWRNLFQCRPR